MDPSRCRRQCGFAFRPVEGNVVTGTLATPGGRFALKGESDGAAAVGQGKGGRSLSPAGRQWDARLRGKRLTQLESYYSGPAYGGAVGGGYSNRRVLDLCEGGEFVYRGSSQLGASSAGVGAAAGGNAADTGRWRIIERQDQVGLELRLQSGERLEVLLQHQDGKTLLDGTRTYVTDDNRSC